MSLERQIIQHDIMGFLERSRSLRRPEKDSRKRSATVSAAQREPNMPSAEARGRGNRAGPTASRDSSMRPNARPRTAGRASGSNEALALPPPPSMDALSGDQVFRFPTPSPRGSTSSLKFSRSSTTIGIALGSPRHVPGFSKRSFTSPIVPQATVENGTMKVSAKLSGLEGSDGNGEKEPKRQTLHKSKSSTWKSFFHRKQSRPAVPDVFDQSQLPPLPVQDKPISACGKPSPIRKDSPTEAQAHHRGESRGDTRRQMRAEIDKAQFEKSMSSTATPNVAQSKFSSQLRPIPSRTTTVMSESSQEFFDAVSTNGSNCGSSFTSSPSQVPSMPRLDISIPDIGMERYSVMFEKLLKPQQSISERRQTFVRKLQLPDTAGKVCIIERAVCAFANQPQLTPSLETPNRMQRRATSPNLAVHTPLTAEALETSSQMATPVPMYRASGGPRLLQRSKTAPPGAISPARQHFEQQQQQQQTANTSTAGSEASPIWSESSLPPTPTTASSDTETFVSFDYGGSDDEAEIVTYHHAKPMMPNFKTPAWDMPKETPAVPEAPPPAPPIPPKAPGRANSPPRDVSVPRLNGLSQHPPRTSSLGNEEHKVRQQQVQQNQSQIQIHRPVQISIARQVSVVRRPTAAGKAKGSQARDLSPKTEPSPVFSKQPLRPKVVEVRNRKSTMIVLDSA